MDFASQFFMQFSFESLFEAFFSLNFSTREFPFQWISARCRPLRDERLLDDLADDSDGIEEMDVLPVSAEMDTIDSGARHRLNDDAEMGLGAEARSAEELEEAALGHELRGKAAHMRDGEVHGEMLFDSPDAREPN